MTAYYNEHDPFAAAWLRELIKAGHIAPGIVDERSIEDVRPSELAGYTQCHFFAGIGGWSLALRQAGWPDDRPVWTGSCPCQPFSAAGKGAGTSDERHLWPAFFHLIEQCQPGVVFGEQVEAAIKHGWLDLVQTDLEGIGYAFGAVGLPAASVGAPHIRARAWFVAESAMRGREPCARDSGIRVPNDGAGTATFELGAEGALGELADAEHTKRGQISLDRENERDRHDAGRAQAHRIAGTRSEICELADTNGGNPSTERQQRGGEQRLLAEGGGLGDMGNPQQPRLQEQRSNAGISCEASDAIEGQAVVGAGTSTFWSARDWLPCRDGKARPVEPGTFPLAHGVPARVGRLRGYGNAIVPQVAAEVIGAYLDAELLR